MTFDVIVVAIFAFKPFVLNCCLDVLNSESAAAAVAAGLVCVMVDLNDVGTMHGRLFCNTLWFRKSPATALII